MSVPESSPVTFSSSEDEPVDDEGDKTLIIESAMNKFGVPNSVLFSKTPWFKFTEKRVSGFNSKCSFELVDAHPKLALFFHCIDDKVETLVENPTKDKEIFLIKVSHTRSTNEFELIDFDEFPEELEAAAYLNDECQEETHYAEIFFPKFLLFST